MAKSRTILISIIVVIALILGAAFVWRENSILVEEHETVSPAQMMATSCGFHLDQKTKVTIDVDAQVLEGEVKITLQTDKGEVVHSFESKKGQCDTIILDAGDYEVRLDSDNCRGQFDVVAHR